MNSFWFFVAFVSGYALSEFFRWDVERYMKRRRMAYLKETHQAGVLDKNDPAWRQ